MIDEMADEIGEQHQPAHQPNLPDADAAQQFPELSPEPRLALRSVGHLISRSLVSERINPMLIPKFPSGNSRAQGSRRAFHRAARSAAAFERFSNVLRQNTVTCIRGRREIPASDLAAMAAQAWKVRECLDELTGR
jgi:hypothetical protein